MNRRFVTKYDVLLLAGVLAAAAVLLFVFSCDKAVYARIIMNGQESIYVNLAENKEFFLPQNPNVVFVVKNGAIAVLSSDCPHQICVNMGFINSSGSRVVCLPNRVAVVVP